jgi:hypothetical protein
MTAATATQILTLPDPNDASAVEQHRQAVLEHYRFVFEEVDRVLQEVVPKANDLFGLMGGPPDKAVHAMNTRYMVRATLGGRGIHAEDEVVPIDLEWVANCGICIHVKGVEIRVLKAAPNGDIPKANSQARARFYCSNQLQLFDTEFEDDLSDLKLIALWDVDSHYAYTGLEIACPRGELNDGTVDCFWTTRWSSSGNHIAVNSIPADSELDLDEIEAIDDSSRSSVRR